MLLAGLAGVLDPIESVTPVPRVEMSCKSCNFNKKEVKK